MPPTQMPLKPNRREFLHQLVVAGAAGLACGDATAANVAPNVPGADRLDFKRLLRPVPTTARFEMDGYYVWCGTMTRTPDRQCHLLFSRWPKASTFRGWVSHSEVGHATADTPLGPYRFRGLALQGAGTDSWDQHMIHNPTVLQADGKYYLYYTGTRGQRWTAGQPLAVADDYWIFRNNQRVGVAVADHPAGPWKRFDRPVLDVSATGWDTLITTNPSVTRMPDGRFLMIYKAASPGEKPAGKVVHGVAFADSPLGPFRKHPQPIFTHEKAEFPAEDPTVWYQDGRYYAILKDMGGFFSGIGRSLVLFTSANGIDWKLAAHPLVSGLQVPWADGTTQTVSHLERPNVFLEQGRPTVLFCAVNPGAKLLHSFNVHIPLQVSG